MTTTPAQDLVCYTKDIKNIDGHVPKRAEIKKREFAEIDIFGWEIKLDALPAIQYDAEYVSKQDERSDKWSDMIKKWNVFSISKRTKLKDRIKKGIPQKMRGIAWIYILDPTILDIPKEKRRAEIIKLVQKGTNKNCCVIEADLPRTMPQCPKFYDERTIEELRMILYAYNNDDTDLGYTQGMSYIAATLLHYIDYEDAYFCFRSIMQGERHKWREFFIPGFPYLNKCNELWNVVLKDRFKKTYDYFQEIGLHPYIYTTSWFLTAFLSTDFPIGVRLRVFDMWLYYGLRALISFGLAIIHLLGPQFRDKDLDQLIPIIQKPQNDENVRNYQELLKQYKKKWIRQRSWDKYKKEANYEGY